MDAHDPSAEGPPVVVLVAGEPGIGKTRLLGTKLSCVLLAMERSSCERAFSLRGHAAPFAILEAPGRYIQITLLTSP